MTRPEGYRNSDKKTTKHPCRDCWDGRAQCSSFSPDERQPVRRCIKCWGKYYMKKWTEGLREAYKYEP